MSSNGQDAANGVQETPPPLLASENGLTKPDLSAHDASALLHRVYGLRVTHHAGVTPLDSYEDQNFCVLPDGADGGGGGGGGGYVLKVFSSGEGKSREFVLLQSEVMAFLRKRGFPVPEQVPTRRGEVVSMEIVVPQPADVVPGASRRSGRWLRGGVGPVRSAQPGGARVAAARRAGAEHRARGHRGVPPEFPGSETRVPLRPHPRRLQRQQHPRRAGQVAAARWGIPVARQRPAGLWRHDPRLPGVRARHRHRLRDDRRARSRRRRRSCDGGLREHAAPVRRGEGGRLPGGAREAEPVGTQRVAQRGAAPAERALPHGVSPQSPGASLPPLGPGATGGA
ncbi:uncharacterized protein LOC116950669 isoform X4 [Petromyzon marinus]|uniref:uncharacterized protein LOC116950669 isoform X4 n=1 Tax=Petromyzon marinus TaxID=7757 RepID=UPI003F727F40